MPFSATALDLKDKELLLYVSFNEGKGKAIEDMSPHGNDGELVGDGDWVDGKFGKAMGLEQAGEVKMPYIELNEKSFTVTMWVKPALSGGDQQCVSHRHRSTLRIQACTIVSTTTAPFGWGFMPMTLTRLPQLKPTSGHTSLSGWMSKANPDRFTLMANLWQRIQAKPGLPIWEQQAIR